MYTKPVTPGEDLALEADCVARVRDGDTEAFASIAVSYRATVVGFAAHLVGFDDAEDLASDVFERLLSNLLRGGGPRGPLRPYLLRMVRNAAVDLYRRRRDRPSELIVGDEPDSCDQFGGILEAGLVQAAYSSLPQRWCQVLWLAHVEQHNRTEIAAELRMRPGAVSQLALRAREGFRNAYLARLVQSDDDQHPSRELPDYAAGKMNPDEAAPVERHLRACQQCTDAVLDIRAITKQLGKLLLVTVGPFVLTLPWRTTESSEDGVAAIGARRTLLPVSVVATLLVVAALAFGAPTVANIDLAHSGGLRDTRPPAGPGLPVLTVPATAAGSTDARGDEPSGSREPGRPTSGLAQPGPSPTGAPTKRPEPSGVPTPTPALSGSASASPQPSGMPASGPVTSSGPTGGATPAPTTSWWEPPVGPPSAVPVPVP